MWKIRCTAAQSESKRLTSCTRRVRVAQRAGRRAQGFRPLALPHSSEMSGERAPSLSFGAKLRAQSNHCSIWDSNIYLITTRVSLNGVVQNLTNWKKYLSMRGNPSGAWSPNPLLSFLLLSAVASAHGLSCFLGTQIACSSSAAVVANVTHQWDACWSCANTNYRTINVGGCFNNPSLHLMTPSCTDSKSACLNDGRPGSSFAMCTSSDCNRCSTAPPERSFSCGLWVLIALISVLFN